jgi:hypothetical protein
VADLFDRLNVDDATKIPIHAFHAAIADYLFAGGMSKADIVSAFNLDAQASANLDTIIAKIDAQATAQNKLRVMESFIALLMLMEHGTRYTDRASFVSRFQEITA